MSLLQQAPRFDGAGAEQLARGIFALDASASPLTSERDQNFLLTGTGGDRYVLKIANASEPRAMLEAENAAMAHLAPRVPFCPRALPAIGGGTIGIAPDGYFVRLVTFLEGAPLATAGPPSPALLADLGRSVGCLDAALADFDHPAIHRDFYWDLANAERMIGENVSLIGDDGYRALVESTGHAALDAIEPRRDLWRRSAVHHDANEWNVLVRGDSVSGIVDFGDMVYSWTVADPAVLLAYALLLGGSPHLTVATVIRAYDEKYPLEDAERASVFPLAILRLCMSACIAASQQRERPGDEYLGVSQAAIRRMLPVLATMDLRRP